MERNCAWKFEITLIYHFGYPPGTESPRISKKPYESGVRSVGFGRRPPIIFDHNLAPSVTQEEKVKMNISILQASLQAPSIVIWHKGVSVPVQQGELQEVVLKNNAKCEHPLFSIVT
jgi:hypothetical protein